MNQPDFATILDDCIQRMQQGESLASCLADYPEQAAELTPMLELTADLFTLPPLEATPAATQRGWDEMMAAWDEQPAPPKRRAMFTLWPLWWPKLVGSFQGRTQATGALVLRTAMAVLLLECT